MLAFFLSNFKWFLYVLTNSIIAVVWFVYVREQLYNHAFKYWKLTAAYVIASVIANSGLMMLQYYVWSQNPVTLVFLEAPIDPSLPFGSMISFFSTYLFHGRLGYFLYYCLGRIWYRQLLAFGVAFVLAAVVRMSFIKDVRASACAWLTFLCAFVVGWPVQLFFIPLFVVVALCVLLGKQFWSVKDGSIQFVILIAFTLASLFGPFLLVQLGLHELLV